jgi:hypothetical protein
MTDREATQAHAILNCLVEYTGQFLSGDLVEEIANKIKQEMRTGSCSWAFSEEEK